MKDQEKNYFGDSMENRIEWGLKNKRCPYCGKDLEGVKIVGSGRFEDGKFCSLDCYARFHHGEPKAIINDDKNKIIFA